MTAPPAKLGDPGPPYATAPTHVGLKVLAPRTSRERAAPDPPTMVNLRMTGLCHSPGQSIQLPTVPAPHVMEDIDVVPIGLMLGECVGLEHRQNLAASPAQHQRGGALKSGSRHLL